MWYLIPPLPERGINKVEGHGRRLKDIQSEVIELELPNDQGTEGIAWVFYVSKDVFAKEIFVGNNRGILFARRSGGGIGVTYSVHNGNIVGQAAKFVKSTSVASIKRFIPNTKYRVGSILNAARMSHAAVKAVCTLQVFAMDRAQYESRSDGIYFTNSNRLAFNTMLRGLQEAGIISTNLISRQEARELRKGKDSVVEI